MRVGLLIDKNICLTVPLNKLVSNCVADVRTKSVSQLKHSCGQQFNHHSK